MAMENQLSHTAQSLMRDLNAFNKALRSEGNQIDPHDKHQLLNSAKELLETLEGPEVAIWRVVFGVSRVVMNGLYSQFVVENNS